MKTVIQVKKLSKTYRTKVSFKDLFSKNKKTSVSALESLSLEVQQGECVGLLGANGAGKTTLVKILCGIQQATSGIIEVLGSRPSLGNRSFYRSVGVVFGHKNSLWWDLPLQDSFEFTKVLYDISEQDYQTRFAELSEALGLTKLMARAPRTFSLGERVKSELMMNLLPAPRVLFLDEPTVGLDVTSKYELRSYLNCLRDKGEVTIVLTSHDLQDIEGCCSRIVLLKEGRKQFDGTVQDLKQKSDCAHRVSLIALDETWSETDLKRITDLSTKMSVKQIESATKEKLQFLVPPKALSTFSSEVASQFKVSLQVDPLNLEEVLRQELQSKPTGDEA